MSPLITNINLTNNKMIFEVKEVLTKFTRSEDVNKKAIRNSHPESTDFCYLKLDRNKRWVTGYTPGYYDSEHEEAIQEEIRDLKEVANISFDVNDEDDPYLSLLKIERALPGNRMPLYNTDDAHDLFKFRAAIANGYIAPRKEDVGVGKFFNTTYYFQSQNIENKKSKDKMRLRASAFGTLAKNEKERAWLVIQCFLNGMNVKSTFSNETLYTFLGNNIENADSEKELEQLIKTFNRKNQEIESVFVAKKAIDLDIVTMDQLTREFVYVEPKSNISTVLGSTIVDVEKYLSNPKKNTVYADIRKAVYKAYDI